MNTIDTATLTAHDEITGANLWTKVPGKERIYLDTAKLNGGQNWNGGRGYQTCFIDLNTGMLVASGEAGAKTRKMLAPVLDAIAAEHGLTLSVRG